MRSYGVCSIHSLLYQRHGVCRDAEPLSGEAKLLLGRCLDAHAVKLRAHRLREYLTHLLYIRRKLRSLRDNGAVDVSDRIAVLADNARHLAQQLYAVRAEKTVVIVREDLLDFAEPAMPTMLEWKTMADNDSMYNTPPCYTIYMLGLVADWLLSIGGLDEMKARNEKKAALLYGYLDGQDYYIAPVRKDSRSMMNVTFVTGNADLDKKFAAEASAAGLKNLKGHRSVGGMRASIYNAMPYEGVEALVAFMKKFAADNPKA